MTATLTPLPRDPQGNIVLPGQVEHVTDYDFAFASALPAGLTASGAGTVSVAGSGGAGVLSLATTATAASQAVVSLPAVDLANVASARLDLFGMTAAASQAYQQLFIGISSGTIGGGWRSDPGSFANPGQVYCSTDRLAAPYTWGVSTIARAMSADLSVLILPAKKIVAALVGDQVIAAGTMSLMTTGTATPSITVQSSNAGVKTYTLKRIRLTVRT